MRTLMNTNTQQQTTMNTHTHTHTYTPIYTYMQTYTYTHAYIYMYTCIHLRRLCYLPAILSSPVSKLKVFFSFEHAIPNLQS